MKLDNPKDKEAIQETLKQGKLTEFWNIIEQALDDSIKHLQYMQDGEEIKDLPADQYKLEAELIKAKKSYLEKLKHFPDTLGLWLVDPDQSEKEFDPYLKPEEIVL